MPFKAISYPPNWRDEIRPAILKRDGYKCLVCGVKQRAFGYRDKQGTFVECDDHMTQWANQQGISCFTIYLSVGHTCHDTLCENPKHLKTMCPRCHNAHDLPNRLANRKYKLKNSRHVCSGRK